jgi:hypothetical protein
MNTSVNIIMPGPFIGHLFLKETKARPDPFFVDERNEVHGPSKPTSVPQSFCFAM